MSTAPLSLVVDDQREMWAPSCGTSNRWSGTSPWWTARARPTPGAGLEDAWSSGREVALIICHHLMPQETGVSLPTRIRSDERFRRAHAIPLTGMATQEDTIEAINSAHIDRYIREPWDSARLLRIVREELTRWLLESGLPLARFTGSLAGDVVLRESRRDGNEQQV